MIAKNSKVYQGLFKKLDALRATLSDEERNILDSIFTDEVRAHKIAKRVAKRVAKNTPEVSAHRVAKRVAKRTAKRVTK